MAITILCFYILIIWKNHQIITFSLMSTFRILNTSVILRCIKFYILFLLSGQLIKKIICWGTLFQRGNIRGFIQHLILQIIMTRLSFFNAYLLTFQIEFILTYIITHTITLWRNKKIIIATCLIECPCIYIITRMSD